MTWGTISRLCKIKLKKGHISNSENRETVRRLEQPCSLDIFPKWKNISNKKVSLVQLLVF